MRYTSASQNPSASGFVNTRLPRLAPIRRLIQPRQIPLAARHHDRRIRIERLHAAKVQMLRARRNGARLPQIPAVFRAQHRAIRARSPRHASAHVIDAAQIRRRARALHLPLRSRRAERCQNNCKQPDFHTQQCRPGGRGQKSSERANLAPSLPCSLAPCLSELFRHSCVTLCIPSRAFLRNSR